MPILLACLLLLSAPAAETPEGAIIHEASGIARAGDAWVIVGDDDDGAVFRVPLQDVSDGPLLTVEPRRTRREAWPLASLAIDLEGVGLLGDGRTVVLSEQLAALVDSAGLVALYGGRFVKFGERGVEGVAVRHLGDGRSRVAVLWEGGYPSTPAIPRDLLGTAGFRALRPEVWVHDLEAGRRNWQVSGDDLLRVVPLDVPLPPGREPEAQRFRAPDLAWFDLGERHDHEWGFIALISSMNGAGPRVYAHHWLQRFGADGRRIGDPIDLDALVPASLRGVNWEGLCWHTENERLAVIFEHDPERTPLQVLLVDIPRSWR